MYNRYIRNDHGTYTRIPQEDQPPHGPPPAKEPVSQTASPSTEEPIIQTTAPRSPCSEPPRLPHSGRSGRQITDNLTALLRHGLDQLRLQQVDTGDLLLLGLLFLLFREDADEELLVALGLMLIL